MESTYDSRNLEEELKDKSTDSDRIKAIKELKHEVMNYGGHPNDWEDGITFVHESYFTEYCEELAYDCGYLENLRREENPIAYCIDWDKWARDCSVDYTQVEFEGETYLYR
tara:strand:- start:683 stop:1015 length:333 start_codon:yes stop_codon:yes gene_type:complete